MAKAAADKNKPAKAAAEVKMKEFTMETTHFHPKTGKKTKGEPMDIVAPEESLDKDGNAESALGGVYRVG